jgi:hypothetical protein
LFDAPASDRTFPLPRLSIAMQAAMVATQTKKLSKFSDPVPNAIPRYHRGHDKHLNYQLNYSRLNSQAIACRTLFYHLIYGDLLLSIRIASPSSDGLIVNVSLNCEESRCDEKAPSNPGISAAVDAAGAQQSPERA